MRFYLDEILVEAVIATVPATNSVHKSTCRDVDVGAHKTRPWLGRGRPRAQKIALSLLCQSSVCVVSSQVRQVSPLKHQSTDSGESICLRTIVAAIGEEQIVGRHSGAGLKCIAQGVCETGCLLQEAVDFARLLRVSFSPLPVTGGYSRRRQHLKTAL